MSRLLVILALAGCAADGGPRLTAAAPAAAGHLATVTLSGTRLCGDVGDCAHAAGQIQIGIDPPVVQVGITSYADTSAQIVIPAAAPVGMTAFVVTVNDHASNALAFEVLP